MIISQVNVCPIDVYNASKIGKSLLSLRHWTINTYRVLMRFLLLFFAMSEVHPFTVIFLERTKVRNPVKNSSF